MHEISSALASLRINIQELSSRVESAPMAGIPLFNARISVALPADLALEVLQDHLERIANALDIDIHLAVNTSARRPPMIASDADAIC